MVNFAAEFPRSRSPCWGGQSGQIRQAKNFNLDAICPTASRLISRILVYHRANSRLACRGVAAFLGICIAFEMPAINALVPELVKRDEIATAIALDRSVFHDRVWSVLRRGIFVAWWGAAPLFLRMPDRFRFSDSADSLPPRTPGTAEEEEQRRSGSKRDYAMFEMIAPFFA